MAAWAAGNIEAARPVKAEPLRVYQRVQAMNEDDELMARVAAGGHDAFALVVSRHLDRVIAIAQRVLGDRTEAEDIAQEALLRVWRHADRWRPGEARISTWLYKIAVNLCLDRKRRPAMAPLEAAGDPPDPGADAFAQLYRAERETLVRAAMAALPERQRVALTLSYYEGLGNIEAAEIMEISVGALESLLVRARRALADRLGPLLGPDRGES